jgi:hypothetical protein
MRRRHSGQGATTRDSAVAGTARALPGGSRRRRRGGLVEGWQQGGGARVPPVSPQRERRGGECLAQRVDLQARIMSWLQLV